VGGRAGKLFGSAAAPAAVGTVAPFTLPKDGEYWCNCTPLAAAAEAGKEPGIVRGADNEAGGGDAPGRPGVANAFADDGVVFE
jgi:hypothetical protein